MGISHQNDGDVVPSSQEKNVSFSDSDVLFPPPNSFYTSNVVGQERSRFDGGDERTTCQSELKSVSDSVDVASSTHQSGVKWNMPSTALSGEDQESIDIGTDSNDDEIEASISEIIIDGSDDENSVMEQRVHDVETIELKRESRTDSAVLTRKSPSDSSLNSEVVLSMASESDTEEEGDEERWSYPEGRLPEEDRTYGVDARDVGTSDSWVRRHPELIRLTGRHPFNCEAPLPKLMAQGFLTPTNLHYVRNHGYVPQGEWVDWRIDVCGRVKRPLQLSMKDLLTKFRHRELPVTLVCAGNRRMEQNLTAKTIGFNWGAAGLSTSVWKGVLLRDVLLYCGVKPKRKGAHFVCFEGAETLPAGGGTRYGTSISMDTAMDPARDVLVAFEQNGKVLDPDHGYPVRMILPGHIGGRMVKWLTKIEVTSSESYNYYHFNDNRVLPSHVDAEMAKAEGWWYKPDYIINELNINSAITTPAHDEMLAFAPLQTPYTVKGYAYTGGGRKVIRVELSLDAGSTWRLCDVTYNEKPTEYGKYWCWVLWQLDVDVTDFLQTKELIVRAWDASMNTQPERLTWNVMGMMNNCWFRVKVHGCKTSSGGVGLKFEHPTIPGQKPGGWMYTENAAKAAPVEVKMNKSSSTPSLVSQNEPQISMSEVRKHTDSGSAWIVVHDVVYDCTSFLKDHPGGGDSILLTAGTDATEEFDGIHSEKAKVMLEKYRIGILAAENASESEPSDSSPSTTFESSVRGGRHFERLAGVPEESAVNDSPAGTHPVALNPRERINLELTRKEILSSDVRKLRFALQSKEHILGLPVGKHVLVAAKIAGKLVMRAYTPTSCDKDVGYVDLLIKVYAKSSNFPMGGLMSQHLDSLKLGDTIGIKGPLGHIHYQGRGKMTVDNVPRFVENFAMLAGGTGITPMYQIIRAVLEDPEDTTQISLIYSNRLECEIMAREQLDRWQEERSNFRVWYTLSGESPSGWTHGIGRITERMMKEKLPPGDSPNTFACLCGPSNLESACLTNLVKMGYKAEDCFQF